LANGFGFSGADKAVLALCPDHAYNFSMNTYLLKNCDIANFDALACARKDILIRDGRIVQIADSITPQDEVTQIDAAGKLALPGFTDAHTHLNQTFLKGYMDDYPITEWLIRMFTICDAMDEETHYYSVLVGCLSALRFGTTTVNEMVNNRRVDSVVQAVKDAGIRATVGIGHTDVAENEKTPVRSVDQCLQDAKSLFARYHNTLGGMLRASVAPLGLPACSKELVQTLKRYANENGLIYHTHLAEGKKETEGVLARTGMREGEALFNYGILDENTLLAHSIWLEDYELELIARAGANPVHCPNTNLKISDGIPKIQQMLDLGINVCLGCDGEASSSTRDMIREARLAAYLQKGVTLNPKALNLSQSYKMMTENGARALGYKDLGKIETGYQADLILVDLSKDISTTNQNTRLSNLLYAGCGHAVDTVFAGGELIISGGENQRLNIAKVLERAEELLEKLHREIT